MSLTINREEFPSNKRILVTSDIHGHTERLCRLLEKAEFSDDDILVIVGDMIEKGPDSLGTLRLIMKLSERENVRTLAGNNDMLRLLYMDYLTKESAEGFYSYLLDKRYWYGTSLFDEMAKELDLYPQSPENLPFIRDEIYKHFAKEIEFIRNLPTILETQNYIFVHGGLPQKDLDNLQVRDIYGVLSLGFFHNTELCFDKYVVAGHFPVNLYNDRLYQFNPIIDCKKKIISIDGGCGVKREGQLNLLIIPHIDCSPDEITSIYTDDFPEVIAKEKQTGSADSFHFHWGRDPRIEILREMNEFVNVRFIAYDREMRILKDDIYKDQNGEDCSRDCTDHMLSVDAGEKLSLIKITSEGILAKKNGVIGWYCKGYENL